MFKVEQKASHFRNVTGEPRIVSKTASVETPWALPRYRNWIAVGKVHALVERALTVRLARLGLKLNQYDILANVHRFDGLTQQRLAEKLLVGRSNLSMSLPDLERRGLLQRIDDAGDMRVRKLRLTPAGEELALQALAIHVGLIEEMMEALTTEECERLGDFMRRVGAHMARLAPPAT